MTLATWLTIVTICVLGAMSPGPSLAVVMKQTLTGGRRNGIIAATLHALGVGLYALLSIFGLAAVIAAAPLTLDVLQWGGALYLAWLGVKGITARRRQTFIAAPPTTGSAARDGFLVVFLNPKIAIFFLALFSQVAGVDTPLTAKLGYAATALVIDASWYLLVAWLLSSPRWMHRVQEYGIWLDRVFGAVLLYLAICLAARMLQP